MEYRKEIDGLRALAVIPVLLFHAGFEAFSGGFVGVDIFFVLSGYLITSILLKEISEGRFSLLKFYERRARRIFPALFTVIFSVIPFAWFLMLPQQWEDFAQSLVAVALFASNIFFWLESDYFAPIAEEKPLLHTWSLAVEEQYYIIFPLLLVFLWRFGRNPTAYILAGLAGISLLLSEWGWRYQPSANFYLLPSRAWELLAGALAALYLFRRPVPNPNMTSNILGISGLILIGISVVLFDKSTPFPSLFALIPVAGTLFFILFAHEGTVPAKALSMPVFVGTGLISYSLYLWHQPLFAFERLLVFESSVWLKLGLILLSYILALISYRFVEQPMRKDILRGAKPFKVLAVSMIPPLVLLVLGGFFLINEIGSRQLKTTAEYGGENYNWRYQRLTGTKTVLLYGDSHARQYATALDNMTRISGTGLALITHPACISYPGVTNLYQGKMQPDCADNLKHLRAAIKEQGDMLVIAQRWGPPLVDSEGQPIGALSKVTDRPARAALLAGLEKLLQTIPQDFPVMILGNVPAAAPASPAMTNGLERCRQYLDAPCPALYPENNGELRNFNAELRKLGERYKNLTFIDPYESLCSDGKCLLEDEGGAFYSDEAHLTEYGAAKVITANRAQFIDALNQSEITKK